MRVRCRAASIDSSSGVRMKALYFMTGSSGAGKTSLLNSLVESVFPDLVAYHFDELGIPSLEVMNTTFGGPQQWQAHMTRQWLQKAAHSSESGLAVIEGQARPNLIVETGNELGLPAVHITLIDCSHAERRRRLLEDRQQPELDNLDTYAWAAYLRGQADALNLEVIDTTMRTRTESMLELAGSIVRFATDAGIKVKKCDPL